MSPTRLALALSGGPSSEVQQEVAEGYVIVETNYRVKTCSSRCCSLVFRLPEVGHMFKGCDPVAFGSIALPFRSKLGMKACQLGFRGSAPQCSMSMGLCNVPQLSRVISCFRANSANATYAGVCLHHV